MKLNVEQIKQITTGAEWIEEVNDSVKFHRFTPLQEEMYAKRSPDFFLHCDATAGVRLSFKTNSKTLCLKGSTTRAAARSYYSIDIFVNNKMIGNVDDYDSFEMTGNYIANPCPLGDFSKEFSLGDGVKEVTIYLPWSVCVELRGVCIDDGSFMKPIKFPKTLLAFGDSITQGYDALRPSNRYVSLLADKLGAQEYNKAIGGDVFFPDLAKTEMSFIPDYILVAYGTNDWNKSEKSVFDNDCKAFYEALSVKYPSSKIFAVSPIWRKDIAEKYNVGTFFYVEEYIAKITENLDNVFFVSGTNFIPGEEKFFADLWLHPNDAGFEKQFDGIYEKISKYL